MKRFLLIIFTLISLNAFSQLQVKEGSFRYVPGGVIEDKEEYTDGNELPMALIKISTENINEQERLRLKFSGNRVTQIIKKPRTGQMWIYISAETATFINIMHPDYGTCKYYLPEELCDYCVYEMVLQYIPIAVNNEPLKPQNTYLVIKADQDDADIFIDGQFVGTKQVSKSFDIGSTHTWKIECDLYHEESGTVTLDEKKEIVKSLRPAYGYMNVSSLPESGAMVYINNKKVGLTPYKSERLVSGTYSVKVVKEMYQTTEKTFTVTDNQTTNAVLNMSANFVDVTINTDSESMIYVDEEYKGKGTWKGRLSEGVHFVEAKKESHETSSKNVSLVLGKSETINIKAPKPIYGFLDINSDPMSANIYLNGVKYGQTPNVISNLLIGDYELKLQIEGCPVLKKNITIKKGETLFLNEVLETGKDVRIKTDTDGDKIYVDGEYVGLTPLNINLTYGTHKIEARRGTQTTTETVNVTISGNSEFVLAFGKLLSINSSKSGDDIYIDGKKVGVTPKTIDVSLGSHEIDVKRGKLYDSKTVNLAYNSDGAYYFTPQKEPLYKYLRKGVNYVTVNAAYSFRPQLSYGLTFGSVRSVGWYASFMSNFDFTGFSALKNSDGGVVLSGESCTTRLSVMGGFIVRLGGPVYMTWGAGYGTRVKCWEDINGNWYKIRNNSYYGLDLSMGLMFNLVGTTFSADVVTTNFKMLEVKVGFGFNKKK